MDRWDWDGMGIAYPWEGERLIIIILIIIDGPFSAHFLVRYVRARWFGAVFAGPPKGRAGLVPFTMVRVSPFPVISRPGWLAREYGKRGEPSPLRVIAVVISAAGGWAGVQIGTTGDSWLLKPETDWPKGWRDAGVSIDWGSPWGRNGKWC